MDLINFIEPKINTKPNLTYKYRLWPPKCLEIPEFFYPIKDEALKVKKTLEKLQKPEEEKVESIPVPDPKKGSKGGKEAVKKDTKKDPKKDAKKAAKKGAKEEVIEKKVVPMLDWPIYQREKIFVEEGSQILDCIPNHLLAVKAELAIDNRNNSPY